MVISEAGIWQDIPRVYSWFFCQYFLYLRRNDFGVKIIVLMCHLKINAPTNIWFKLLVRGGKISTHEETRYFSEI